MLMHFFSPSGYIDSMNLNISCSSAVLFHTTAEMRLVILVEREKQSVDNPTTIVSFFLRVSAKLEQALGGFFDENRPRRPLLKSINNILANLPYT